MEHIAIQKVDECIAYLQDKKMDTHQIIQHLLNNELHKIPIETKDPDIYLKLVSNIAKINPAAALSFGMHLYSVWGLKYIMSAERWKNISQFVSEQDYLFSSLNEPALYFLSMKQVNPKHYPIKAIKDEEGNYQVTGIKHFVSLEPYVSILPVYALVENDRNHLVVLLIQKEQIGVSIRKSWDTISMKDTHSNDVILDHVIVERHNVILEGKDAMNKTHIFGYLFRFIVSSVYFGIANSVVEYTKSITKNRSIPHFDVLLGQLPGPQYSLARMIILQQTMKSQIEEFARQIKEYPNEHIELSSLVTKQYIAESSKEIVELAMKIQGISSIGNGNKLAQMYEDVAAGMFHPPQTDILLEIIAKRELGILSKNKRWI